MIETETSTRARANTHRLADGTFEALVRITERDGGLIVGSWTVVLGVFPIQHDAMLAGLPVSHLINVGEKVLKSRLGLPIKAA